MLMLGENVLPLNKCIAKEFTSYMYQCSEDRSLILTKTYLGVVNCSGVSNITASIHVNSTVVGSLHAKAYCNYDSDCRMVQVHQHNSTDCTENTDRLVYFVTDICLNGVMYCCSRSQLILTQYINSDCTQVQNKTQVNKGECHNGRYYDYICDQMNNFVPANVAFLHSPSTTNSTNSTNSTRSDNTDNILYIVFCLCFFCGVCICCERMRCCEKGACVYDFCNALSSMRPDATRPILNQNNNTCCFIM